MVCSCKFKQIKMKYKHLIKILKWFNTTKKLTLYQYVTYTLILQY